MPSQRDVLEFLQDGILTPRQSVTGVGDIKTALSADGNTALIGCPQEDNYQGAAWVFVRFRGAWTEQAKLISTGHPGTGFFGQSVALSGDGKTALVSSGGDLAGGTAKVFTRSGGVWTQQGSLLTGGGEIPQRFGFSVALSTDGNTAMVSDPGDSGVGAVWVFVRNQGVWTKQGPKLLPKDADPAGYGTSFGASMALSADGDTAVMGGRMDNRSLGAAWVFTRTKGVWAQQGKFVGDDPSRTLPFGQSVALSADGNTALIGTFSTAERPGQAFVFTRSGGVWKRDAEITDGSIGFGHSVALSADGNLALIGSPNFKTPSPSGTASVYSRTGSVWTQVGGTLGVTDGSATSASNVALSRDGHTVLLAGTTMHSPTVKAWAFDNDKKLITHVCVLMLENHSFDNIFGFSDIPGIISSAKTKSNEYGNYPPFHASSPALPSMPTDPGHEFADVVEQLCGKDKPYVFGQPYPTLTNSGFVSNYATTVSEIETGNPRPPNPTEYIEIMKCFDTKTQLPVIYQLATEFALCDQWFSSMPGPTFPNRFFLHGASSSGLADSPPDMKKAEWALGGGFNYEHGSIFDALSDSGIGSAVYTDSAGPFLGLGWIPPVCVIKGIQYILDTDDYVHFRDDIKDPSYPEGYHLSSPIMATPTLDHS